jgi:hypothetical protein
MAQLHTTNRQKNRFWLALLGYLLVIPLLLPYQVGAQSSANYQIQEDFLGGGGTVNSNSANFRAQDTIGAPAAGDGAGTDYRTQSGATTTNDPSLTFSVDSASVSLGSLSTSLTRTGTSTFSVLNYTSYGYIVQTLGNPPSNGGHTLSGMSSPGTSTNGTEQFGINLIDNSSPDIGASPSQVPDSSFGFGTAAASYNTPNNFKYISGNTIASAPKSSGKTTYTISYIANISNNTPGGSYSGNQTLVVVGTY